MQSKFNIYDILGYIIPGSFLLGLFFFIFVEIRFLIGKKPFPDIGIGESILFIIIAYIIGHILQSIFRQCIGKNERKFSIEVLKKDNPRYSAELKEGIKKTLEKNTGIKITNISSNEVEDNYQEAFKLAYFFVVQKGISPYTELYNSFYALYRGLLAISYTGIILGILNTISLIIYLDHTTQPRILIFLISITFVIMLVFRGCIPIFRDRFKLFAEKFVDSIYYSFYLYYITNSH
ncbi:hypothetical protein KAW50_05165 [candidate division WOR-3 bacterium]|nr:hypothetical protein [candidate division WOR-3 bacterium]